MAFDEIEALFSAVVDLGPDERPGRLAAGCNGRPELRAEVESLLAWHKAAAKGPFLSSPTGAGGWFASIQPPDPIDQVIGRFRLRERIGAGGMGVVYRGEPVDNAGPARAAVKLIPLPLHNPDALRRFQVEGQILAALDHPDIVTLLDAGLAPGGEAYLAMAYIDGVPITEYCSSHSATLDERLRLFQRVCGAVQYAHQQGVVHRDLKPANILVTPDGAPTVIDFGVAKLLEPPTATVDATAPWVVPPLTPNYASPEQLRGLPVTTASDVYALGVLLYEMLTGARPYDVSGRPLDEVLKIVAKRRPRRPSRSVVRDRIPYEAAQLEGDLDAIVLKAISKPAAQRYASLQELSDDITRHFTRQPLLAA